MSSPRISLMDVGDRDLIHESSLDLLERVGVCFGSSQALLTLEQAGCRVDHQDGRVRIPRQLVEWALAQLKRDVLLAGRTPAHDATLDGSRTYCTVAGICPSVVDIDSGLPRNPRLEDLATLTRLADALDAFGIVWYSVSPTDGVAPKMTDLAATACMLSNTDKHVMGQVVDPAQVPYALEILKLCAEPGSLALRPLFSAIYCPVAPLQHDGKAIDAAMMLARNFVPIDIFSLGLAGATAPVTLAGTITQTNCEVLSAVVLLQCVAPGCPLIYSANAAIMDMRTSRCAVATPETVLMNIAQIELAHSYNMPALSVGFVSDAGDLGLRGGMEDIAFALPTRLAGPDIMTGLGTLASGQAVSFSKTLLDAELVGYVERVARGMAIDPEHVAASVIAEVGPGGHYLGCKETRIGVRNGEHWTPRLFGRAVSGGTGVAGLTASGQTRQAIESLLAGHEPVSLTEQVTERIADILRRAEAELPD
jgi:trimethylamine---corrinoid protein Co-methyltransferase